MRAMVKNATIGDRIRAKREAAGMSQAELGAELGVAPQQISKYERHDRPNIPRTDKIERLARALDVNANWLITGTEFFTEGVASLSDDEVRALAVVRQIPPHRRADWFRIGVVLSQRLPPEDAEDSDPKFNRPAVGRPRR